LGRSERPSAPSKELAAVYAPLARVYLLSVGIYYCVITLVHPAMRDGMTALIMTGVAGVTALFCLSFAWRLRKPAGLIQLQLAILAANGLMLGNVLADQALGFEEHQLVYHVLLAVAFATAGPTRRVAYPSVAAALISMFLLSQEARPEIRDNGVFLALAAGFISIGMSMLARSTVMRELTARLAAERLAGELHEELARNEELRRTAQALALSEQVANRTKTEFLATITHELRTPLNGVLGMAQVMAMDELSPTQRARLATIQESGKALLATINDVLDISKIEAGRLELSPTVFDLGRLSDDLERLYASLAAEKGLTLTFEVDPGARGWRRGDDVRLRQVISNLLSNALKFTEEGSITVFVRVEGDLVRVSVADTGIGVAADQAPFLFEKFVQADASTTRRFGGTGLGLAISREIVGLMGGDIDFTSAAGEGSCFTFQVPLPKAAAPGGALEAAVSAELGRVRALVADDNAVNRTVVQTLLAEFGIQSVTVESGEAALEAWEREAYDLILMDIHMPGMDGLAATKAIRARERASGRARTPILALTASVLSQETDVYFAAGMDDFVAKPIELSRLMEAIQSALDHGDEAPQAVAV
jgi:two-component system, sensor histidine kinase